MGLYSWQLITAEHNNSRCVLHVTMAPVAGILAAYSAAVPIFFLAKRAPYFPDMTSNKSREGGPSSSRGDKPSLVITKHDSLPLCESVLGIKMQEELSWDSSGKNIPISPSG